MGQIERQKTQASDIPTLSELFTLTKTQQFQLSATNLVAIDRKKGCVYKATLRSPLNKITDFNSPDIRNLGSKANTLLEIRMLRFLSRNGINTPKVFGTNKDSDVFAMEYVEGSTLLDKILNKTICSGDVVLSANLLGKLHSISKTERNTRWIKINSRAYPRHFPNRVEGFLDKYNALYNIGNKYLRDAFIEAKKHLDENPNYMVWNEPVYGDYKPENMISTKTGTLVFIDPGLRMGRASFDLGKFVSRMLLHKCPENLVRAFIKHYQDGAKTPISTREISFMTALDMVTILSVYDSISKGASAPIFAKRIYKLTNSTERIINEFVLPLLQSKFELVTV